jgi:hypothetical protein
MYKCLNCNKLSNDPAIVCETPTKCNIMPCESICYASSSGTGLLVGIAQTKVTNDNKSTVVSEEVKLHCNCTDSTTQHTTAIHAVSCISCLNTLKKE